jgi:hypothetical protein
MKITANERAGLLGIYNSEFQDGQKDTPCHAVWTWSANPFKTKRQFSGVVTSLVAKGLCESQDIDRASEAVIWLTPAGLAQVHRINGDAQAALATIRHLEERRALINARPLGGRYALLDAQRDLRAVDADIAEYKAASQIEVQVDAEGGAL